MFGIEELTCVHNLQIGFKFNLEWLKFRNNFSLQMVNRSTQIFAYSQYVYAYI